jgi:beta-galactosidase
VPPDGVKPDAPLGFRYAVRYADGDTAEVPVRFGRGVGSWVAGAVKPLPEAAVAWSGAFPAGRGPADKRAVVYQMQWTNPYPGHEIASVDVAAGPAGTPVLLGLTAATARK